MSDHSERRRLALLWLSLAEGVPLDRAIAVAAEAEAWIAGAAAPPAADVHEPLPVSACGPGAEPKANAAPEAEAGDEALSRGEAAVLAALRQGGPGTGNRDLAAACGLADTSVPLCLRRLEARGLIRRSGRGRARRIELTIETESEADEPGEPDPAEPMEPATPHDEEPAAPHEAAPVRRFEPGCTDRLIEATLQQGGHRVSRATAGRWRVDGRVLTTQQAAARADELRRARGLQPLMAV